MAARGSREIPWTIVAIGGVLVVLVLVAAAVGFVGLPMIGPQPTPAPVAPSGNAEPAGPALSEPAADAAWWQMRTGMPADAFQGNIIDIGTLDDGVTATVEVAFPQPQADSLAFANRLVIGPRLGHVVTIGAEGTDVVLTSIDATTGEANELVRTGDIVVDAAFASGSEIVFLTADRITGAPTGLWRIDALAPGLPEPVEGAMAAEPPFRLVARIGSFSRLFVSPDGGSAAVMRCELDACLVRSVDLADGTIHQQAAQLNAEPIGLIGHVLLVRPICVELACGGELLNLATGERRAVPGDGWWAFSEALIRSDRGVLLVGQTAGATAPGPQPMEPPAFRAVELETLVAREPIELSLGSMSIQAHTAFDVGVELPPGWFVVRGSMPAPEGGDWSMPMTAFAVEAATGRLVPLPALGEIFVQG